MSGAYCLLLSRALCGGINDLVVHILLCYTACHLTQRLHNFIVWHNCCIKAICMLYPFKSHAHSRKQQTNLRRCLISLTLLAMRKDVAHTVSTSLLLLYIIDVIYIYFTFCWSTARYRTHKTTLHNYGALLTRTATRSMPHATFVVSLRVLSCLSRTLMTAARIHFYAI